jgi:arylsulfatase A-like enzyme
MGIRNIRDILNEKRVAVTVIACLLLGGAVVFNFREPIMDFGKNLMLSSRQERVKYERFPVYAEKHSYRTVSAIPSKGGKAIFFDVPIEENGELEVGVVRTSDLNNYEGEFRFRVYQKKMFWKSILLEAVHRLRVGEQVSHRLNTSELEKDGRTARIFCELKPIGNQIRDEQSDDFLFLEPNFFRTRNPEELNILLISFDTLRADHLGCYGYELRDTSPNIDAFAEHGILFTQAISSAPWTTPSHYSLFTALYPSAHGNDRTLPYDYVYSQRTLTNTLKDEGYYTIAFTGGGSISAAFGFANGFNIYNEYSSYSNTGDAERPWIHEDDTAKIFEHAVSWLEKNGETKFFMFVHIFEPHDPYEDRFFLHEGNPGILIEQRRALYDGDIRRADSFFGEMIKKLDSLGLMSSTLIVFLSDHGDDFYDHYRESDIVPEYTKPIIPNLSVVDHAHSLYDEVLRVPLIFYIPGLKPAKTRIENQVRLIDVMPTMLDHLNIQPNIPIQGVSLMDLILRGSRKEDPAALSEMTVIGPRRIAIRKDGYKYIKIPDLNVKQKDMTYRTLNKFELFNLARDPKEQHNIYDQNSELAQEYDRLLEKQVQASLLINKTLKSEHDPNLAEKEQVLDDDIVANLKALGYLN